MELNTVQKEIPFETHITVDSFAQQLQQSFIDLCELNNAKPLFIELSKGDHIYQPMLGTVIHACDINSVLHFANKLSKDLVANNFILKRLKIEVPAEHADIMTLQSDFSNYFEWHGKINYINITSLMRLCDAHKAHLSSNSLKNEDNLRFITLREFGTRQQFENRVRFIINALIAEGRTIVKQESEYCIYDNNIFLDKGWLPH